MMHELTKRRPAFTLIEILVVIAIIAILAALTSAGVFVVISGQQRRNTQNTIRVLDKLLQDRWKDVVRKASNETPSPQVLALAGGNNERAKVIWIKVRLVEAFPMKYSEVIPPASPPAQASIVNYYAAGKQSPHFARYQTYLNGKTGGGPGESAACLLMALKFLSADGVGIDDQLKYAITTTDGTNKIDTLMDGWSKPLAFNRFDFSAAVQAANPVKTNQDKKFRYSDPEDPEGSLLNVNWYLTTPPPNSPNPLRVQFESGTMVPPPGVVGFHSIALVPPPQANPRANYILPTITSAGKDGNLGTSDDIINIQLRTE